MKWLTGLKNSLKGWVEAVGRYPLTAVFLVAALVANIMAIETPYGEDLLYVKLFLTFVTGAFFGAVAQVVYERMKEKASLRILLMAGACLGAGVYYLILRGAAEMDVGVTVRTACLLSALLTAYVWVPSIKSERSFNEAFLGVFKAFFVALLFSGVLFAGVSMILSAVDLLLFRISYLSYMHAANVIFTLFASLYFLSLVPDYQRAPKEQVERVLGYPRFLEILLANIIIPLVSVFTVILIIYIARNITGSFWQDNLMEPMLVAYSIVGIVVLLLAGKLENRIAQIFYRVFPKVLIPVVLFQTLASILKIGETGLTHGRYYVILYGAFAFFAGIVFSFFRTRWVGLIAPVLIVLSLLSIVPPVDAFTVSRNSQVQTLERALVRNGLLVDGQIVPKEDLAAEEKRIIANTSQYLWRMGYQEEISWLPQDFEYYLDFERVFGFHPYQVEPNERPIYPSYMRNRMDGVDISGYDRMTVVFFNETEEPWDPVKTVIDGETYYTGWERLGEEGFFYLRDEGGQTLASLPLGVMLERLAEFDLVSRELLTKDVTFEVDTERARMKVVLNFLDTYPERSETVRTGEVMILFHVKE